MLIKRYKIVNKIKFVRVNSNNSCEGFCKLFINGDKTCYSDLYPHCLKANCNLYDDYVPYDYKY